MIDLLLEQILLEHHLLDHILELSNLSGIDLFLNSVKLFKPGFDLLGGNFFSTWRSFD
jgi:hypothetical protein